MNLNNLFPIQKELDQHIVEKHNLQGQDLLNKKTVALTCELYECVNETKIFKFWSVKNPDREKMLEEYVDTLHFALSIGNDLGYTHHTYTDKADRDLNSLTIGLTNLITIIPQSRSHTHMKLLFDLIIKLGYQLGFDEKTVTDAYMAKNETNFVRQANGY